MQAKVYKIIVNNYKIMVMMDKMMIVKIFKINNMMKNNKMLQNLYNKNISKKKQIKTK